MKIIKLNNENHGSSIATAIGLDEFIDHIQTIKLNNLNVVSIRDSANASSPSNKKKYEIIDNSGINNLYKVTFDDLADPSEEKLTQFVFPQYYHIQGILQWAKQKWEENGNDFVVHCTGGVSRSAAIAMLINQMIMNDYRAGWDIQMHSPNQKVLEYGEQHLGIESFRDIVKEKTKEYDRNRWEEDNNPFR